MLECKYGKEPLDTRLCFLRLVRKAWLVLAMAVVGAVLFGGIYFLTHVVYGPAREYVAESEFYIEYVGAVTQEQQYTYYNKETWESLIHTDIFMDEVMAGVKEQTLMYDRVITREEVSGAIFATLLTDVRIVHVTVTTNNAYLTMAITNSLESAFVKFGESQREIDAVRSILIPEEATLTAVDNRTVRACILGAVVCVSLTLFVMYLYVVLDTSIYIPLEFERRFGIPMVLPDEMQVLPAEVTASEKSVFLYRAEDGTDIVCVKSGDHNRPLIEKTIRDAEAEGKIVQKAVLLNADEKLIKWYFKTKFL